MKKHPGVLWLLAAAVLWSTGGVFSKRIPWDGLTVAIVRGAVAFFALALVRRRLPWPMRWPTLLPAICFFGQGILLIASFKYTTAANTIALQYTSPLFIIVFSALLTRKLPQKREWLTCLVLVAGIFLTCLGEPSRGGMRGNLLAIGSGLCYAGVFFTSRLPGADAADAVLLGSGLYVLCLPLPILSGAFAGSTAGDWALAVAFGVLVGAGAWTCFARGIRTTPSLTANFIAMLEPVLSPVWTFLLLREKMSVFSLLGCAVVLLTLCVYYLTAPKAPPEAVQ